MELGQPGWNEYYGWGRVDFGAAAAAAAATLPNISSVQWSNNAVIVSAAFRPGLNYSLWRAAQLTPPVWAQVTNALLATNNGAISLTDPAPFPATAFYRVQASR